MRWLWTWARCGISSRCNESVAAPVIASRCLRPQLNPIVAVSMSFSVDHQLEMQRQSARGRCLHFGDGARCNEIISAHSIQRGGQLSLIAEGGHVYRLRADLSTLKQSGGVPRPKKVGLNKASTFPGFCKHHDNVLFAPIDTRPLGPSRHQAALYAYRSVCREYFVKENAVAALTRMKDHADLNSAQRSTMKTALLGHSVGFEGLMYHKAAYDEALRNERYDEFQFTYFMSASRCSLQVTGLLYPDRDFRGDGLQDLGNWQSPLDLITFFTAPTPEGWAFGFAWHNSSSNSCVQLLQSLASIVPSGEGLEDALLRFALSCCENHAVRISWWDSLPSEARQAALERMELMAHPSIPVPPDYLSAGCEGMADWKFEYVHTTLETDASQVTPAE